MQIDIPDGQLFYYESWLEDEKAWSIFAALQHEIDWEEGQVFIFGRWHSIPRLQAWYGEPGLAYTYSGKQLLAKPWTPALHSIKTQTRDMRLRF